MALPLIMLIAMWWYLDADLQHPPELILEMLKFYHLGYDDVYEKERKRKESF